MGTPAASSTSSGDDSNPSVPRHAGALVPGRVVDGRAVCVGVIWIVPHEKNSVCVLLRIPLCSRTKKCFENDVRIPTD